LKFFETYDKAGLGDMALKLKCQYFWILTKKCYG